MKQDVRNGLTARLAVNADEIAAAQRLRYQVFVEELGAKPDGACQVERRESDRYDALCDHLLVVDQHVTSYTDGTELADGRLVGTYRLLRQDVAEINGGFYSAGEFAITALLHRHSKLKFLEIGRSCVAASHRGRAVAEHLWQGIWDYVRLHNLDVMMGCASLPGTDPARLAHELSCLHNLARPPAEWQVSALPHLHVNMNILQSADIDRRSVMRNLPTLIKAYIRVGAYLGEGAVVDHAFNTTDVLILLPVANINPKYFGHYGAPT